MQKPQLTRGEFISALGSLVGGVALGKLIGTKRAVVFFARLRGIALSGYGSTPYGGKHEV